MEDLGAQMKLEITDTMYLEEMVNCLLVNGYTVTLKHTGYNTDINGTEYAAYEVTIHERSK